VFDKNGFLFTAIRHLRPLDPIGRLTVSIAGGRGTYGITVTPKGDVLYASLAGSHIAKIDVATGNRPWSNRRSESGCTAVCRTPKAASGQRVEQRNVSVHDPPTLLESLEVAGQRPAPIPLCRRQEQGATDSAHATALRSVTKIQTLPDDMAGAMSASSTAAREVWAESAPTACHGPDVAPA